MLGRLHDNRNGNGRIGQLPTLTETLRTAGATVKTTEQILPAIETMAGDYQKHSGKINFLLDYWPVTLFGVFLMMAGGAFAGSVWVDIKRKKRGK